MTYLEMLRVTREMHLIATSRGLKVPYCIWFKNDLSREEHIEAQRLTGLRIANAKAPHGDAITMHSTVDTILNDSNRVISSSHAYPATIMYPIGPALRFPEDMITRRKLRLPKEDDDD